MKRTSLVVPAVAVLLGGGAIGCSAEDRPARTRPVAAASSPEPQTLTLQVASREFHRFVNNDDVARASGDERLALNWVGDGQSSLTASAYRQAAFRGEAMPRYDYNSPKLYVPKLSDSTYPQWFVAVSERAPKPAAGTEADPADTRTSIMAFIRRSPEAEWKLSLATVLADKAELPEITLDPQGYAEAVLTDATDLLIQPKTVPGIQSAIAEEGPENLPAGLMKAGPGTTGYFNETREIRERAGKEGLAYDVVFPATLYPIFSLRTADRGALVLYALGRDAVTLAKNEENRPPIPTEAAHLLDSLILGNELRVSDTLQFAAYDPPKPKGNKKPKADVIAIDGAPTSASAPRNIN